ncbi:hypothetical protein HY993_01420 [Candidatus Micrarchaeota archaeon]|nr:hypothetical protein [Candidatus Micrarchaeota archaeon]
MFSNEEAKNFVEEHPDYEAKIETIDGLALEDAKKKQPVLYSDVTATEVYKIMLSSPSSSEALLVIQDNEKVLKTFPVTKISVK